MSARGVFIQIHVALSCGAKLCWLAALMAYAGSWRRHHVLILDMAAHETQLHFAAYVLPSHSLIRFVQLFPLCHRGAWPRAEI